MCTKEFATANNFTPANVYGLPNNGLITNTAGTRTYQMAPFTGNNALYMFPTDSGKLFLTTPGRYTGISLLVLATENTATVNVTFKFTDSTTQVFNSQSILDWFNTTTTNLVVQGFGRIKRKVGPFATTDYEGGNVINPHMYSLDFSLSCSKTLAYIIFKNVSSTVLTASNRAFVLGVSGITGAVPATPVITPNPLTLCGAGPATLTVSNAAASGVTYTWYRQAVGGFPVATGATYTTGTLTTDTTLYVLATNSLTGCVIDTRVPVTVRVSSRPAAPTVNSVSVCPNNTATLTISSPVTGLTYSWYTAATGGTPAGTGVSYTTPVITASTTYYAEATNAAGCTSATRTPLTVTFLPKLASPTAQATSVGVNTATFSWSAVTGAVGYQVSVNGGAFQNPSSGATGLTHVANGLPASTNVTFRVFAVGPQPCQNSDTITVTAKTLSDEIYIPNVFTPNGDGKNDVFRAYGNAISTVDMKIFDQWGEAIFESTNLQGWDGSYKGKQQPVGVYVYVIKLKLVDGREMLKKGSINLVR
jgi:gliding motility-associated-like protein